MLERYTQYMYSYPHKTAYRPLTNCRLDDYKSRLCQSSANSLYFHIPFCESKCGYCNLFSLAGCPQTLVDDYLQAMARQIAQYKLEDVYFDDLTIGGGTPLYLSVAQLENLFALAGALRWRSSHPAIIIETSPRQTTAEKVAILQKYGVTRVSLGVQSFQDKELQTLGRIHRQKDIHRALTLLREAGFPCLNIDLIYGVPGQNEQSVWDSLQKALEYRPEEIFLYPLYVKPGTALYRQGQMVSETAYGLYRLLRAELLAAGFTQTSMRRFVRPAPAPQTAWSGCGYHEYTLSIGCGGRSYIDELHFATPFSVRPQRCAHILQSYLQKADHLVIEHGYILSGDERKRRFVLKNLLDFRGLPLAQYETLFHTSPLADFPQFIQWQAQGWITQDGQANLRLTEAGLDLSDYLGPALISPEVRRKMAAWQDE